MRRHHRPAFLELDPPADSISLLLGVEADRERWRSSLLSSSQYEQVQRRQPHLFSENSSGTSDLKDDEVSGEIGENEESSPGFLGRIDSCSRVMHAHSEIQLDSRTRGTLPSYSKTMHAFTLNQLNHYQRFSKSAASSPRAETSHVQLPTKLDEELVDLSRDELPRAPSNTPDHKHSYSWPRHSVGDVHGIDFRKLKRSLTEPHVGRR